MLKKLAAIGLGAALILAPVASMAQTSTDAAPAAAAPEKAATAKPKKHATTKHKHHAAKKPAAAAPAEAPKS